MRILTSIVTLIVFVLLLSSCSKSANPVMLSGPVDSGTDSTPEMIADSGAINENMTNSRGVFGAWKIHVDTENLTAEIIPARNAHAIGDIFDADLLQFLTVSPCANCLIIPKVYLDGYGDLNVVVKLKHPFDNLAARPDLHGFDVRGIFIAEQAIPVTYSDIQVMPPGSVEEDAVIEYFSNGLLNADGYTSHFDELVTDSRYFLGGSDIPGNLNPYLRFYEDYQMPPFDPYAPDGQNVMATGANYYNRTAIFSDYVLSQGLTFYLVADVAYGQSATYLNRPDPQYYLPAFHRTEPWRVEYWIENNTLSWMDPTSTADVIIQVFDWQHGATVDANYPDPANLGGIPESSDVLQVELSIPGYQDAPIIETIPESGAGSPSDPLQYRLTVTNSNQSSGTRQGLLAVRDQLYGETGRMAIPVSPSGFPYETQDIVDYAFYTLINVNIMDEFTMFPSGNMKFDNELSVPKEELFASNGDTVLKPDFFMDPGHKKIEYKWDFDYDGVTFDIDGSQLPSPNISFPTGGRYDVGLRVRTNTKPPTAYLYSIPVWSEGTAFHNTLQNMSVTVDATSCCLQHSVAIANDHYYAVFPHEEGGDRNIWLSIGDRHGSFDTFQLTNNSDVSYMPSMIVIEQGVNEGVYVVYSEIGAEFHVYFIRGDLDGTNFTSPVRITTSYPGYECYPILLNFANSLHCYYVCDSMIVAGIFGCHSDNMGTTWIEDGWIVNNTSDYQVYPTVAASYSAVYLIWQDHVNWAERGKDIFMATSSNGNTFTDIHCISTTADDTDETKPSSCLYSDQLAVAYLSTPLGNNSVTNITVIDTSNGAIVNYPIQSGTGTNLWHYSPSIGCAGDGRFTLAFSSFDDTDDSMSQYILEVVAGDGISEFLEYEILNESVGTFPTGYWRGTYPGVVCTSPSRYVTENFVVWTKYNNGYLESPYDHRGFGQIERMAFITERDYTGWW